jgi:hypothetical protein
MMILSSGKKKALHEYEGLWLVTAMKNYNRIGGLQLPLNGERQQQHAANELPLICNGTCFIVL